MEDAGISYAWNRYSVAASRAQKNKSIDLFAQTATLRMNMDTHLSLEEGENMAPEDACRTAMKAAGKPPVTKGTYSALCRTCSKPPKHPERTASHLAPSMTK